MTYLAPFRHTVPCEECQADKRDAEAKAEAERQRAAIERAHAERLADIETILGKLGVTRKYLGVSLENFRPMHDPVAATAARNVVDRFKAGDRPSLYLWSERPGEPIAPGSGKTHLAVAILRALALDPAIKLGDLGFVFIPKLLLEMQATFKHPEKSELAIVKKYAAPELLVWDDFGAEKLSDYAARTLYAVLYEREGKSNVFTSNLGLAEIESRDATGYMRRITSRIAGDARIIRMTGPDHRMRAAS